VFARRIEKIDASGIRKVFDLAQKMTDPVNFSIGQPDFDVPEPIKEAAVAAIRKGKNKYTVTQGTQALREKIRAQLRAERNWEPEEVMITSGVSGALVLALLTLVDEGDEVLIPDPYFVMYKHLVNLAGGTPVFIDTYPDFNVTAAQIEAHVTDRTRLLLLNSPANPTGAIYGDETLKAIAEVARRHNVYIISDEIYERFAYDFPVPSIVKHMGEAMLLGGFSKTYAMTGWRLGFAAGPKEIIEQMTKLQQYTFVCAPSMAQEAGLAALDYDVGEYVDQFRRKRDLIYGGLQQAGYEVTKPHGAFYIFPKTPWGTDEQFVTSAIGNNVLVIPGSVFSEKHTHFRISYATTESQIKWGIELLAALKDGPAST